MNKFDIFDAGTQDEIKRHEKLDMDYNRKINETTQTQFKDPSCFLDAEHLASQVQPTVHAPVAKGSAVNKSGNSSSNKSGGKSSKVKGSSASQLKESVNKSQTSDKSGTSISQTGT